MINRISTALFMFALLIFANDIFGWGLFPIPQKSENNLSDLANTIMSPAFDIVQNQTGVDVNPTHTFGEIARLMATR